MDNRQFLDDLDMQLNGLPDCERSKILKSFSVRMGTPSEEGQDSISPDKRWGQPQAIAAKYKAKYFLNEASRTRKIQVSIRAALLAASVKPVIYLILPALLAIGLVLIGLILLAVFMSLTGLATSLTAIGIPVIQNLISLQSAGAFEGFYTGIVIIAAGLLFLIAAHAIWKFYLSISAKTLKRMAGLDNIE